MQQQAETTETISIDYNRKLIELYKEILSRLIAVPLPKRDKAKEQQDENR